MTDGQGPQGIDLKHLQERLLGLARLLLGTTGTAALGMTILYGLGFIVANVSLARYGVFELSLVREHCLAAGLSFSVFSLLTVLIGWAVIGWLVDRLEALGDWLKLRMSVPQQESGEREGCPLAPHSPLHLGSCAQSLRKPRMQSRWTERARAVYDKACKVIAFRPRWAYLAVLAAVLATAAIGSAAIRSAWLRRFPSVELTMETPLINFDWFKMNAGLFVWAYVFAVVGGICATYLGTRDYGKILRRGEGAQPDITMLIKLVVVIVVLLLSALISYGGWVYPDIPQSLAGGSPVFVEFIVKGEAVSMLETLSMTVGEGRLTERVEYLGQTADKVIVVTQDEDAVSFDAALVEASSFLPVEYSASADRHVDRAKSYRVQGKLKESIAEYDRALLIDSECVEALVGLGAVYTDQYVKAAEGLDYSALETDIEGLGDLRVTAEGHLDNAIKHDPNCEHCGQAYYELARLYAQPDYELARLGDQLAISGWDASNNLEEARKCDSEWLKKAMQDPDFDAGIKASERLRGTLSASDVELVQAYEDLGYSLYAERQVEDALQAREQVEGALHAYQMAADLAERLLTRGNVRSAENHAHMARIYTATRETGNAIDEYRKATELDESNAMYRHELASLYYAHDDFAGAIEVCNEVIESGRVDEYPVRDQIDFYVLRGNAYREVELWTEALSDYFEVADRTLEGDLGASAAKAFYHLALLETRSPEGNLELALTDLEKAIWLDRELSTVAQEEPDFDLLRKTREGEFQTALSPPVIERIEVSDTLTMTFHLSEPRGDFVRKLMVLTELAGLKSLVTYGAEIGEWVGVQAYEDFEISEDGLRYDFYLKEDADYNAEHLRSRLSELLGLEY